MKWAVVLLTLFCFTGYGQVIYSPDTTHITRMRLAWKAKILTRGKRKGQEVQRLQWVKYSIPKVDSNVDKAPRVKGGWNSLTRRLRRHIKFKSKHDVRLKEMSLYRMRLIIDTTGCVSEIEYVSGKKLDGLYKQIHSVLIGTHWRPAIVNNKKVYYAMPVLVGIPPHRFRKSYQIKVARPLKYYSVF